MLARPSAAETRGAARIEADGAEEAAAGDRRDQDRQGVEVEGGAVGDRLDQLLEHAVGEQDDDRDRQGRLGPLAAEGDQDREAPAVQAPR